MYKKCSFELVDDPEYCPCRKFMRNDLAEKLVKTCKADKMDAFKRCFEFNVTDTFNSKQESITETIKETFEVEDIQTEYKVPCLDYRIVIYFHKYKLAVDAF